VVKKLDKLTYPPLENHVGASLWRLSELWKKRFDAEMVALGHDYFAEARSNILRYIGPNGVSQSIVVKRMGLSKQAVQQLLDELVTEGVVTKLPDPKDQRGKLVVLTQLGLAALHDANKVKNRIQKDYEKLIGAERLTRLVADLELLTGLIVRPDEE
jgi:DNA-binding MarR family transcriptional regulator